MQDTPPVESESAGLAKRQTRVWIGLGSNLGHGPAQLQEALKQLEDSPGVTVLQVSSMFRTEPWGVKNQPEFTNAVAELSVSLDPMSLLKVLKRIERAMGRTTGGRRWGPRAIDLDILLFGDAILHLPGLTVPHPRMHLRPFVLVPLFELAPSLQLPGRGRIEIFMQRCESGGVQRLDGE